MERIAGAFIGRCRRSASVAAFYFSTDRDSLAFSALAVWDGERRESADVGLEFDPAAGTIKVAGNEFSAVVGRVIEVTAFDPPWGIATQSLTINGMPTMLLTRPLKIER